MNKMIDEMALKMMRKPETNTANQQTNKPGPYSRTSQQQPANKQPSTTRTQEQPKSTEKIQHLGKISRHGKHDRHLIQKSPIRSKEQITPEQTQRIEPTTQSSSGQNLYSRNTPQTKIQQKPVQPKSNPYSRPNRQPEVKPSPQTEAQYQQKSKKPPSPPSSILYPNRRSQYNIKSNQKKEQEKQATNNNKPAYSRNTQPVVQTNENQLQANRSPYNRSNQYGRNVHQEEPKQQVKVQTTVTVQRSSYGSRPNPYNRNTQQTPQTQAKQTQETKQQTQTQPTIQRPSYPSSRPNPYNRTIQKNEVKEVQQIKQQTQTQPTIQRTSYPSSRPNPYNRNTQQTPQTQTKQTQETKQQTQTQPTIQKPSYPSSRPNQYSKNVPAAGKQVVQQVTAEKAIQQEKPKKRSNMIIYSIIKMQNKLKTQTWNSMKQYADSRFRKLNIFGKILTESANTINYQYFNGIMKHFMKQMKVLTIKQFKNNQKNRQQSLQRNTSKQQNLVCWLTQALFKEQLRSTYKKLNNNRNKLDLTARGVGCLAVIQKKKLTNYSRDFIDNLKKSKFNKEQKLSSMVLCLKNFYNNKKKLAFSKLIKHNIQKPTKKPIKKLPSVQKSISPAKAPTPQKDTFNPTKQSVENLKLTIGEKKDAFVTEKRQYEEYLEEFKSLVKQNERQLQQMNIRNEELKNKIETVRGNQHEILIQRQDIDPQETEKLNQLIPIYIDLLKLTDGSQCSPKELINQYKLPVALIKSDQSIQNWQLMLQHTNLKNLIQSIEGIRVKERKAVTVMQEEQKIIRNLIRSYIKQRYLWEWVRASLHA